MKPNDKKEFSEIFTAMGENFNATVSKEGLRIRFEALNEFSIEQVKRACIVLVKNRVYPGMPTTGEIRVAIMAAQPQLPDPGTIAELRVSEVMGQIRAVGSYGSPKWEDPIVADLLSRRWAWSSLCAMTEEELKWWAKDFVEAYKAVARADKVMHRIADMENRPDLKLLVSGIGRGGKKE